jgi:hypothetical protein
MKYLKSFNEDKQITSGHHTEMKEYCEDILIDLHDINFGTKVVIYKFDGEDDQINIDIVKNGEFKMDDRIFSDVLYSLDEYLKTQGFRRSCNHHSSSDPQKNGLINRLSGGYGIRLIYTQDFPLRDDDSYGNEIKESFELPTNDREYWYNDDIDNIIRDRLIDMDDLGLKIQALDHHHGLEINIEKEEGENKVQLNDLFVDDVLSLIDNLKDRGLKLTSCFLYDRHHNKACWEYQILKNIDLKEKISQHKDEYLPEHFSIYLYFKIV